MSDHQERTELDDERLHLLAGAKTFVEAVIWRPWLWPVAVSEASRMARRGWWRSWPPIPLPDIALWRFRMETAYGNATGEAPSSADVRAFLEWCRGAHDWRRR